MTNASRGYYIMATLIGAGAAGFVSIQAVLLVFCVAFFGLAVFDR